MKDSDVNSIGLCKIRLPMPKLWGVLGLRGEPRRSMRSPFRDDANDSFSVFQKEGKWYFKDHNPSYDSHHGDEVTLIEIARSVSRGDAIKVYHELARVEWEAPESGHRSARRESSGASIRQPVRKSTTDTDGSGVAKRPQKRSDYKPDWSKLGQVLKIYDYLDAEGEILHQTFRFDPKNFRQRRRPVANEKPADDGWVYVLDGIEPVLYRLPEIQSADEQTPIFLVEGEKDADTLKELGLLSTTTPMGAGKWKDSYGKVLAGKWVVIISDNDEAGKKHADLLCQKLHDKTGRLGVIYLADKWEACPPKGDISEWMTHCIEEPQELGLADSSSIEEVLSVAHSTLLNWANQAGVPGNIVVRSAVRIGEKGGVTIIQSELASVILNESPRKFSGEVWWSFDGARWKQDEIQRGVARRIEEILSSSDPLKPLVSKFLINSIEEIMANRVAMHPDKFNSHDSNLINVANGMLDIRDFSLVPHDPRYLSTVQLPHRFDPTADCPQFKAWLSEMLPAKDPQEQIQEIFGYCLAPGLNYHKFFFFYGDGGTGKSTCIDVMSHLVGPDNTIAVRLQDLDNAFVRAQLVGRRLYLATELNRDSFKHIDLVKAITSGDPIHVEKKHKDGYTYRPQGRFIMASNVRAMTGDTTDGFFRRLCQVTWENKVPEERKDFQLLEKFKTEMDGILFWSLQGLQRLMSRGRFSETSDSQKAAREIQMHRASAKAFFEKCITKLEGKESSWPEGSALSAEDLHSEYLRWCEWEAVKPHYAEKDSLVRELINRLPWLKERRERKHIGDGKKIVVYRGLQFVSWRGDHI